MTTRSGNFVPEGMPPPDNAELAHSRDLSRLIEAEIDQAGGAISFDRYMDRVLYAPGLGYYCGGKRKFGAAGDFITAPEISPLFSRCLGKQCQQVLERIDGGRILEFGPGSGLMAAEILYWLARHDCLPEEYLLLDISADLRELQQTTLQRHVPELMHRVRWLDTLPEAGFQGVMLANEVLDAMPVHRIDFSASPPTELCVRRADRDGFSWQTRPVRDERLLAQISRIAVTMDQPVIAMSYVSEINIAARDWIGSISDILSRGLVLLIDYGFPRREFYHAERRDGTLMCHYRHRTHGNPLVLPGLQDITAHVDFTAIAEAALDHRLEVAGYTTQAHFLLSAGLPRILEQAMGEELSQQITLNQQIKKLTLPHEMGELFKVMALTKNLEIALQGFSEYDMRNRL